MNWHRVNLHTVLERTGPLARKPWRWLLIEPPASRKQAVLVSPTGRHFHLSLGLGKARIRHLRKP